ncbi:MAG TPA: glycosyltransferase family 4 protein, partial [Flavobacteriales bacterium]
LRRAALTIHASHWAADAARKAEPSAASKVKVQPFGVNLPEWPERPAERAFPGASVELLFIGVKWVEKGGPIAYEALLRLKERGLAAKLTVIGCDPPMELRDPDLVRVGFLDKNDHAQLERLEQHLRSADFLIVPTRFEAYGIVFCEAAAYGIPALGTRTGGVPTIIEHGRTGFLVDPRDGGAVHADHMAGLVAEPARWQAMRRAARQRFEEVLNWDAFVDGLIRYAEEAGIISNAR